MIFRWGSAPDPFLTLLLHRSPPPKNLNLTWFSVLTKYIFKKFLTKLQLPYQNSSSFISYAWGTSYFINDLALGGGGVEGVHGR